MITNPESFRFQISDDEKDEPVTNCDRFKTLKYSSSNPYAFTEQGVSMLSNREMFARLERVELKQCESLYL
ncbi:ORF6N domain-containing protein [Lachnoanaerobaculum orale]|uniref:ORF6N domain-containing protein n=1 Tax=Lachnoanaerobaculum orale TaxID=979627 RepID=UPI0023A83C5F|nr:ORF6N domain-containing protein [Lachnoanaerobaculum orale]